MLALTRLPMDPANRALESLQSLCRRIVAIGESLPIVKRGEVVASGWDDPLFAVAPNESVEIGTRRLLPYCWREDLSHVPEELTRHTRWSPTNSRA